jgi:HD-like signal output (HDOD) protein
MLTTGMGTRDPRAVAAQASAAEGAPVPDCPVDERAMAGLPVDTQRRVAQLLETMERMPAQPTLAMRVLWMCNDPSVSVTKVGEAVQMDPVLTSRVLRLANSPYYSLRSAVANPQRAVVMLGCTTVGAVAAAAVAQSAGLERLPEQFWAHSSAVAVAAQSVADQFRVSAADAFATGLLHDLGAGVLRVSDPVRWEELELVSPAERSAVEHATFGITHEAAAAGILAAWRVPDDVIAGVAGHHGAPDAPDVPAANLVAVAEALAAAAFPDRMWEVPTLDLGDLGRFGLPEPRVARLVTRVREEAQKLDRVFQ